MIQIWMTSVLALIAVPLHAADIVENGWLDQSLPVPVMHVEGSLEQIARAHGQLVARHPSGKQTLLSLATMVEEKINKSSSLSNPLARSIVWLLYRSFVRNPMVEHIPEQYRRAYLAFAQAAGLSEDDVLDALVTPDAALRAVSILYGTEIAPELQPNFGCTSVIWDSGNASVLHGRNLDYESVGYWDKNQLVMQIVPKEGLAHVAVTALGVHTTGITAFNEAGLTLAVHQLTIDDTTSRGTPMPIIASEVIRFARNINDAIKIIKSFPRAGGWAYVLSQGRDRAVVETSAGEVAVRRSSERFFYQTNHVSSPALAKRQIFYSAGSWLDSFYRADQLSRFKKTLGSKTWATPQDLAQILTSYEVSGHSEIAGSTVAKLDNVQSVIINANRRRLWIAVGDDDHAPNEGKYIEYSWDNLRQTKPPRVQSHLQNIIARQGKAPKLRALLRKTNNLAVDSPDQTRSALLKQYMQTANDGPGSWPGTFLHVWHELKTGPHTADQADLLLNELERALSDPAFATDTSLQPRVSHYLSLGHLFRGRLFDLLNKRGLALYEYHAAARIAPFERVQNAAHLGIKSRYSWAQTKSIAIDWPGIDLYSY